MSITANRFTNIQDLFDEIKPSKAYKLYTYCFEQVCDSNSVLKFKVNKRTYYYKEKYFIQQFIAPREEEISELVLDTEQIVTPRMFFLEEL